jgi:FAD synthetase
MRVIAFGTFDTLHPGHTSFLKQAKKLGDYLLVVVARDVFVQRAKSRQPLHSELKRLKQIKKLGIADKAILGSRVHNWFRTLRSNKIDLIALGYDQKPPIKELKQKLRLHRLGNVKIVRLRSLRPEVYKSSKIGNTSYS